MTPIALIGAALAAVQPTLDGSVGLAANNVGALAQLHPGLRLPLWDAPGSPLLQSTALELSAVVDLTPSFARLGPRITFTPLSVITLSADWVVSPYFGTFTSLVGFDDPAAVYDRDTLRASALEAGLSTRLSGRVDLRVKLGPAVATGWLAARRWALTRGPEEGWYFEPDAFLMLARTDTVRTLGGIAGAAVIDDPSRRRMLLIGAIAESRRAAVSGDALARAGLAVVWQPGGEWTWLATAQAYLDDRVYDSALPPYLGLQARWTWRGEALGISPGAGAGDPGRT